MDINEYMKRSLELQEKQVTLLEQLVAGQGETIHMQGTHEILEDLVKGTHQAIRSGGAVVADEAARAGAAAPGSTKQAANHDRDDAKQDAEKPRKVSADDVRAALMKLGKVQGSEAAVALLQEHGSTSVSGLPQDKYQDVIDAAEAAAREAGA